MAFATQAVNVARRFTTSAIRRTTPGENLPYSFDNKYKFTLYFTLFFASGFAVPFIAVRHTLLKR